MAALTKTVGVFPKERAIVDRERAKGSYALGPYLLSKLVAEIPVGAAFPLLFGTILYPMARLHPTLTRWVFLVVIRTKKQPFKARTLNFDFSGLESFLGLWLWSHLPHLQWVWLWGRWFQPLKQHWLWGHLLWRFLSYLEAIMWMQIIHQLYSDGYLVLLSLDGKYIFVYPYENLFYAFPLQSTRQWVVSFCCLAKRKFLLLPLIQGVSRALHQWI